MRVALLALLGACTPATSVVTGLGTGSGTDPTEEPPWEDPPPSVLINELLAGNDSVLRDAAGDFDDWVELVNVAEVEVDLAGWALADGSTTHPLTGTLEPGGHVVIWLDGEPQEGTDHAPFSIRPGEDLDLLEPLGHVVDEVVAQDLPDDVVLGRFPSGGPFWSASIQATPGAENPVDPGLSRDPSDVLYPADAVIRIDLTIPGASWDALAANRDALVEASVAFQGVVLEPVQLTIKGGAGSERDITQKAAFRISLDTWLPGQRLRGVEHLTLNNMVQDPSGCHELVAYRLMREAGVPAPRVAHVELWLNGQYRGLYLNVETIDDQFLQRWFDDPYGNLYEGVYGADVSLGLAALMEQDEQGLYDVSDRSELEALGQMLALPPTEENWSAFEAKIEVDRTLRMLAAEVVTQHWDGYFWYPNNYRIYHEPSTDRWTLLPWGTDQTFGFPGGDIHGANGDIAAWCMQVPSCRARYDGALLEMADRLLAMDLETIVPEAYDRIILLYEADPLREATPDAMRDQAMSTVSSARSYAEAVRAALSP